MGLNSGCIVFRGATVTREQYHRFSPAHFSDEQCSANSSPLWMLQYPAHVLLQYTGPLFTGLGPLGPSGCYSLARHQGLPTSTLLWLATKA